MSKYSDKRGRRVEATHPHSPPVSWCCKCNPSYQEPTTEEEKFLEGLEEVLATMPLPTSEPPYPYMR